jgi:hypothetical protein
MRPNRMFFASAGGAPCCVVGRSSERWSGRHRARRGGHCSRALSRQPSCRSRWRASGWSCAGVSTKWPSRGPGSPLWLTRSVGASSATCMTAPSNAWSPSGSRCGTPSTSWAPTPTRRRRRWTTPSLRSVPRSRTCGSWRTGCGRLAPGGPRPGAARPGEQVAGAHRGVCDHRPLCAGRRGGGLLRSLRGPDQRGQARGPIRSSCKSPVRTPPS